MMYLLSEIPSYVHIDDITTAAKIFNLPAPLVEIVKIVQEKNAQRNEEAKISKVSFSIAMPPLN